MPSRGVLTLGFGAPRYRAMAGTLGRSLALHAPSVPRALVTDEPQGEHTRAYHIVLPLNAAHGANVRPKLHLDAYAPFDQTLFIDSDTLAVRGLDEAFAAFEGHVFGPVGKNSLSKGAQDPSMHVNYVLDYFGLERVPKFNGGVYYIDQNAAGPVMQTARELLRDYRRLGFIDFRGEGPNDEAIFAVAMALHDLPLVEDQGRIMATPTGLHGKLHVDTLRGEAQFKKYGSFCSPALVHFAGAWSFHPVYRRERRKLAWRAAGWPQDAIERYSKALYPIDAALGTLQMELRRVQLGVQHRLSRIFRRFEAA